MLHHRLSLLTTLPRILLRWLGDHVPASCLLCGHDCRHQLCSQCEQDLTTQASPRCSQCGVPHPTASTCIRCATTLPAYDTTIVGCDYVKPADQLVRQLKFRHRLAHAHALARLLRHAALAQRPARLPDVLVPVPLGNKRLIKRGFNQSAEIARPLGKMLGIPVLVQAAVRIRDTDAQSLLAQQARSTNLKHAFEVSPALAHQLQGAHVGIVDDVMTTGATLDALATVLKEYGAAKVTCLAATRTPY